MAESWTRLTDTWIGFSAMSYRDDDVEGSMTAFQGQLGQLFHLHDEGLNQSFIHALPAFVCNLCEFGPEDELPTDPQVQPWELHRHLAPFLPHCFPLTSEASSELGPDTRSVRFDEGWALLWRKSCLSSLGSSRIQRTAVSTNNIFYQAHGTHTLIVIVSI